MGGGGFATAVLGPVLEPGDGRCRHSAAARGRRLGALLEAWRTAMGPRSAVRDACAGYRPGLDLPHSRSPGTPAAFRPGPHSVDPCPPPGRRLRRLPPPPRAALRPHRRDDRRPGFRTQRLPGRVAEPGDRGRRLGLAAAGRARARGDPRPARPALGRARRRRVRSSALVRLLPVAVLRRGHPHPLRRRYRADARSQETAPGPGARAAGRGGGDRNRRDYPRDAAPAGCGRALPPHRAAGRHLRRLLAAADRAGPPPGAGSVGASRSAARPTPAARRRSRRSSTSASCPCCSCSRHPARDGAGGAPRWSASACWRRSASAA